MPVFCPFPLCPCHEWPLLGILAPGQACDGISGPTVCRRLRAFPMVLLSSRLRCLFLPGPKRERQGSGG